MTLRLWLGLWIGLSMPQSEEEAAAAFEQMYALVPFLSWVSNLIVIEWWLLRSTPHRSAASLLRRRHA